MGNLESAPAGRRSSLGGHGSKTKRGTGTLSRGRSLKKLDVSLISPNMHDFLPKELEWLGVYFSCLFPKAPSFVDLVRTFPSVFGGDNEAVMKELFRVLDRNHNEVIDFEEFVYACSMTARGSLDRKLAFLFILCDSDEDRIVERNDILRITAQVGEFMIRDGALRNKMFSAKEALRAFRGSDTLLMDRFKQRAGANAVLDRLLGFFDVIFYPVIRLLESELGSAQLFGRALPYLSLRENLMVPSILSLCTQRLGSQSAFEAVESLHSFVEIDAHKEALEKVWATETSEQMEAIIQGLSVNETASLMSRWLKEQLEPLIPFTLFDEALMAAKGNQGSRKLLVEGLPGSHAECMRNLMRWAGSRAGNEEDVMLLCRALVPLVIWTKNVAMVEWQIEAATRLLRLLLEEGLLEPEVESGPMLDAKTLILDLEADLNLMDMEKEALEEKVASQAIAAQKMAERIAELRKEVTLLKAEREDSSSVDTSSSVLRTVAEWAEGSAPLSERDAVEAIARREKQNRIRASQRDPYASLTESAIDSVTITVTLVCGRGLACRDGKLDPYAKTALVLLTEDKKVIRKRDGAVAPTRSNDPDWNEIFVFSVSRKALDQFGIQLLIVHSDKLGRETFLGAVDVALEDVQGANLDDWFPLKQRKPTDKVTGEVRIRVDNGSLPMTNVPADSPRSPKVLMPPNSPKRLTPRRTVSSSTASLIDRGPRPKNVEYYSARRSSSASNLETVRSMTLHLTSLVTREYLNTIYLGDPSAGIESMSVSDQGLLLAVSRPKYLALLTHQTRPIYQDEPELILNALLTLHTWTTPADFLLELFSRYVGPVQGDDLEMFARWELQSRVVQAQVMKIFHEWINSPLMGQEFFKTPALKEMLLTFSHEAGIALRSLNITSMQQEAKVRARSNSVVVFEQQVRQRREDSVFELAPRNVAEQLTLIEFMLVGNIELSELSNQAWNRDGKESRAKHVLAYIEWFNRVSGWIVTQIITQEQSLQRAAAIVKFIDIGAVLLTLQNYNGVIEILSALHASAISRLKETWALVPKDSMSTLEDLDALMNTEGNFRHYRGLLDKSKPPVVPYMGLLLTDLTFMDDANLTETGKGSRGNKLLNLEKIRMLAGAYRLFRGCLSKPYVIQEMRSIRKLLTKIERFDENELYRLSKLREDGAAHGSGDSAAAADSRKQRKLISQITSSMLSRTKLNMADDSMTAGDWKTLLGMSGVELLRVDSGITLVARGGRPSGIFRINTGLVSVFAGDDFQETLFQCGPGSAVGALSVLKPDELTGLTWKPAGPVEVYRIPPVVVQSFCSDLDQSRKFYASLAQNQVELLVGLNKSGVSAKRNQSMKDASLGSWDVEWMGEGAGHSEFRFLGRLLLSEKNAVFSSKMLGFSKVEEIPLHSIKQCKMQPGSLASFVIIGELGNAYQKSFKCLSGSMETEEVIKILLESVQAAQSGRKASTMEFLSPRSASLENTVSDPMALTNADWEALTQGAKRIVMKCGETVMQEGSSYQRMYQVVRGAIRVEKQFDGEVKPLGSLFCSETFGEMSFLTGSAATASCVVATEECELIIMEGYYVNMLIRMRPEIAGRFYKFLAMLVTARIELCFL